MKKLILVLAALAMVGCAGRDANIVAATKAGDSKLTCDQIEVELAAVQRGIQRVMPETDKTAYNSALAVGGLIVPVVPWLFMDLSDAEQMEVTALNERQTNLMLIAAKKDCI